MNKSIITQLSKKAFALLIFVAVLGGVVAGYFYSESRGGQRQIRSAKKKLKEATKDIEFRLPRPDFAVHLPNNAADYGTLDEVVPIAQSDALAAKLKVLEILAKPRL